ncbi:MAG: ammonium transporter [Rhodocyclaceae bacterium]|nr:ammonium transporter [Rhodocyclaceae bacterium]MCA3075404.1 ammonium transporter [Rhodocyclaceae bacterium]MCA3091889.1 ammonium transporter [Rhodocyclaceae bacterium]MCA3093217.1 ammonium transporter [Rhodocyclaceae bacterium]MCA3097408.1 ammonium transporter [Rhodocyclaceae bacterium]
MKKLLVTLLTAVSLAFSAGAIAQPAAEPAKMEAKAEEAKVAPAPSAAPAAEAKKAADTPAAEAPKPPNINKADTTFMFIATVLVIFMIIPGLALFYGGLVRQKNMLSVLMQVFVTFSMIAVLWVIYGYSLAFTGGGQIVGGLDKLFLSGVTDATGAATFSKDVYIPEYLFVVFQLTFAAITPALIVGAFAERMKFSAVLLFLAIWFTFAYLPMAHMVWYWDGPDAITDEKTLEAVTAGAGLLWAKGALDFAGGTVVHINAAVAGLVAAYMIGTRIGFRREAMPPHNLVFTMIGASMLWVGWFGFNVGSNLEANGVAGLAFVNTLVAAAAAVLSWMFAEWIGKGKPSMLGAASGAVAGLVAITPAAGFVGPMGAIIIGLVSGFLCLWGVSGLKRMLGADDALDVFGVHGVGGIVGAILTGVFASPSLGGAGICDYIKNVCGQPLAAGIGGQVWVQLQGVLIAVVLSAVVTFIALKIVDLIVGIRVTEEAEREGLDVSSHGEKAYN